MPGVPGDAPVFTGSNQLIEPEMNPEQVLGDGPDPDPQQDHGRHRSEQAPRRPRVFAGAEDASHPHEQEAEGGVRAHGHLTRDDRAEQPGPCDGVQKSEDAERGPREAQADPNPGRTRMGTAGHQAQLNLRRSPARDGARAVNQGDPDERRAQTHPRNAGILATCSFPARGLFLENMKSSCFLVVAAAGLLGLACSDDSSETGSGGHGGHGVGGTGGSAVIGGAGGGGGGGGSAPAMTFKFTADTEGFAVDTFANQGPYTDGNPQNIGGVSNGAAMPTATFDNDHGMPDDGSIKITTTFNDFNQTVTVRRVYQPAQTVNLSGQGGDGGTSSSPTATSSRASFT